MGLVRLSSEASPGMAASPGGVNGYMRGRFLSGPYPAFESQFYQHIREYQPHKPWGSGYFCHGWSYPVQSWVHAAFWPFKTIIPDVEWLQGDGPVVLLDQCPDFFLPQGKSRISVNKLFQPPAGRISIDPSNDLKNISRIKGCGMDPAIFLTALKFIKEYLGIVLSCFRGLQAIFLSRL